MPTATVEKVKPNVRLLRKTLRRIENNPLDWNQGVWRCKSGMCYAGHAVTIRGGEWITGPKHPNADMLVPTPAEIRASGKLLNWHGPRSFEMPHYENYGPVQFFKYKDRWTPGVSASIRAQRLLRIDDLMAESLFEGSNSLSDLQGIVNDLVANTEAK